MLLQRKLRKPVAMLNNAPSMVFASDMRDNVDAGMALKALAWRKSQWGANQAKVVAAKPAKSN